MWRIKIGIWENGRPKADLKTQYLSNPLPEQWGHTVSKSNDDLQATVFPLHSARRASSSLKLQNPVSGSRSFSPTRQSVKISDLSLSEKDESTLKGHVSHARNLKLDRLFPGVERRRSNAKRLITPWMKRPLRLDSTSRRRIKALLLLCIN